jgi:hypothetical protein
MARQIALDAQKEHSAILDRVKATRSNAIKDSEIERCKTLMGTAVAQVPADPAPLPVPPPPPAPTPTDVVLVDTGNAYAQVSWFSIVLKADGSLLITDHHASAYNVVVPKGSAAKFVAANVIRTYAELVAMATAAPAPVPTPTPTPTPPPTPTPTPAPNPPPTTGVYSARITKPNTPAFTIKEGGSSPFRGVLPWDPYDKMTIGVVTSPTDPDFTAMFLRGGYEFALLIHFGKLFGVNNAPAYKLEILVDDQVIDTIQVPATEHYSCYQWPSQTVRPWPIVAPPASELEKHWVLPFAKEGVSFDSQITSYEKYVIGGNAGVQLYGPGTGERFDIGPMTEPQAEFLFFGNPVAGEMLLHQAEAAGSMPTMFLENGKLITLSSRPRAGLDERDAPELIKKPTSIWTLDTAHQPQLSYVPYLLRCHPFDLLRQQARAMRNHFGLVSFRGEDKGVLGNYAGPYAGPYTGQPRSFGWSLLQTLNATVITPEGAPAPFAPRAEFERLLKNNADWVRDSRIKNTYNAPNFPYIELMRTFDNGGDVTETFPGGTIQAGKMSSPWMDLYVHFALQMGAKHFPAMFQDIYDHFKVLPHALSGKGTGKFKALGFERTGCPYRLPYNDFTDWQQICDETIRLLQAGPALVPGDHTYTSYLRDVLNNDAEWFGDAVSAQARDEWTVRLAAVGYKSRHKYV